MKRIMTVRGEISPDELGFTTIHEHTICDLSFLRNSLGFLPPIPPEMLSLRPENVAALRSGLGVFSDECSTLGDVEYIAKELIEFKKVGGNAVCDASPIGLRGNINDIQKASESADVHIVCATGLYHAGAQPKEFMNKSEKDLTTLFESEIKEGIDGTDIKPGFLKCALHTLNPDNTIHELELKTLRACSKVASYNGMSLHVHTAAPLTCDHIIQGIDIAIEECGMKPNRLHIMHLDSFLRTPAKISTYYSNIESVRGVDTELQTKVLDKGVNIGFDTWGMLVSELPDDFDRLKGLVDLLNKGYASQIALGHDVYDKSRGVTFGYTGYTGFAKFALPLLNELGFGADVIHKLTIENPARILSY